MKIYDDILKEIFHDLRKGNYTIILDRIVCQRYELDKRYSSSITLTHPIRKEIRSFRASLLTWYIGVFVSKDTVLEKEKAMSLLLKGRLHARPYTGIPTMNLSGKYWVNETVIYFTKKKDADRYVETK